MVISMELRLVEHLSREKYSADISSLALSSKMAKLKDAQKASLKEDCLESDSDFLTVKWKANQREEDLGYSMVMSKVPHSLLMGIESASTKLLAAL